MFATKIVIALATLTVARAHFTLDYPWTRGFDEDKESNSPCGGFPLNKTRTPFPLSGGFISYTSHHQDATSVAGISFKNDPTSLGDFNTTSSGSNYPLLVPAWTTSVQGSFCVHVNVSSLGVSGVTNGTDATIVVSFNGGDGTLFQCSDVVLLSDYTIPSSIPCNEAGTITGGSGTSAIPSNTGSPTGSPTSPPAGSNTGSGPAPTTSNGAASLASSGGLVAFIGLFVSAITYL